MRIMMLSGAMVIDNRPLKRNTSKKNTIGAAIKIAIKNKKTLRKRFVNMIVVLAYEKTKSCIFS